MKLTAIVATLMLVLIISITPLSSQNVPSWRLREVIKDNPYLEATMSADGQLFALYHPSDASSIQIFNSSGEMVREIETGLDPNDSSLYPVKWSHDGQYLAAMYYSSFDDQLLRVWNSVSGEAVLTRFDNVDSFMFTKTDNTLLVNTFYTDYDDRRRIAYIYFLGDEIDIHETSYYGFFTAISPDDSEALLIGNNDSLYRLSLRNSYALTQIAQLDSEYGKGRRDRVHADFYDQETIAIVSLIETRGLSLRLIRYSDNEISDDELIYYYHPEKPIIDTNIIGFQHMSWYGVRLFDPFTPNVFFQQEYDWQYLALSPDSKWIAAHVHSIGTLLIYQYPSMTLVSEIEDCFCYYSEFSANSSRLMTLGYHDDLSVYRVMIFDLEE